MPLPPPAAPPPAPPAERAAALLTRSPFQLDAEALFALASSRIVRRGLGYARAGRVTLVRETPTTLLARVHGQDAAPYAVEVALVEGQLRARCTCPFDWEPFCKHALAALAYRSGLGDPRLPGGLVRRLTNREQQEIAARRRRAEREAFGLRRRSGAGLLGQWEVASPSGQSYLVEIRTPGERLNRCSCRDFATSMLGTCKHIEAVLATLRAEDRARFERALREPPAVGQVLVEQGDAPRIRLLLPPRPGERLATLAGQYFDTDGYFRDDPVDGFLRFLADARDVPELVVFSDALSLSALHAEQRQAVQRAAAVRAALAGVAEALPGFTGPLTAAALAGATFLAARGRAVLADDDDPESAPGLQALAAAAILRARGELRTALVVCPAAQRAFWQRELPARLGAPPPVVLPAAVPAAPFDAGVPLTTALASFETLPASLATLGSTPLDLVVLAGAEAFGAWLEPAGEALRNLSARFLFVLHAGDLCARPLHLFSVLQLVDRHVFGPYWAFHERFLGVAEPPAGDAVPWRNEAELRRRLAPVVLRRTAAPGPATAADVAPSPAALAARRLAAARCLVAAGFGAEALQLVASAAAQAPAAGAAPGPAAELASRAAALAARFAAALELPPPAELTALLAEVAVAWGLPGAFEAPSGDDSRPRGS